MAVHQRSFNEHTAEAYENLIYHQRDGLLRAGIEPKSLYLGYKDWLELKYHARPGHQYSLAQERPQYMGLDVYIVDVRGPHVNVAP